MKITDRVILEIFLNERGKIDSNKVRKGWLNKHKEIKQYLKDRFLKDEWVNYSFVIKRILYKIYKLPKCECGKKIKHNYIFKKNYNKTLYCSSKCSLSSKKRVIKWKEYRKRKQKEDPNYYKNLYKKAGIKHSKTLKEKVKNDPDYYKKRDKKRLISWNKTINKKLKEDPNYFRKIGLKGSETANKKGKKFKEQIQIKRRKTWNKKSKKEIKEIYNNRNETLKLKLKEDKNYWNKRNKSKKTKEFRSKQSIILKESWNKKSKKELKAIRSKTIKTIKKLIKENPNYWEDRKKREIETKRKNGTLNSSIQEKEFYQKLLNHFNKKDIKRQYKEERYPFYCDFYIKSEDLFIECNFHWTHNGHWFNKNSKEDKKLLKKWKDKHTKYYDNAIETWTKRDLKKRKYMKKNKLNFIVFWNKKEAYNWLNSLKI